jgi:hypothetical protein
MSMTIQTGLKGGSGVYCGGEAETARRLNRMGTGRNGAPVWKSTKLKSWKSLDAKAKRRKKATPEAVASPEQVSPLLDTLDTPAIQPLPTGRLRKADTVRGSKKTGVAPDSVNQNLPPWLPPTSDAVKPKPAPKKRSLISRIKASMGGGGK